VRLKFSGQNTFKKERILIYLSLQPLNTLRYVAAPHILRSDLRQKERLMARKDTRELIRLVSTAKTGYFYTTRRKKGRDKLELKKYDPVIRQHVLFKEAKIK